MSHTNELNLCCDLCKSIITDFDNDLFHHTGIINGRFNDHIHLCGGCEREIRPPHFDFDNRRLITNSSNMPTE